MAFSQVVAIPTAPSREGQKSRTGDRNHTRWYKVTTDTNEDEYTVLSASADGVAIPALSAAHPSDTEARVSNIKSSATDNSFTQWLVRVDYSTTQSNVIPNADPADDPADVTWGTHSITEVVRADINGSPIENAAGVQYDPLPERERHFPAVLIERYESSFDPADPLAYIDRVNSAQVTIAGLTANAGKAKLTRYEGKPERIRNSTYYKVLYEILFVDDADRWKVELLNNGLYSLESGDLTRITDVDQKDVVEPQNLTAAGAYVAGTAPNYLTFEIAPTANFAALSLPTNEDGT